MMTRCQESKSSVHLFSQSLVITQVVHVSLAVVLKTAGKRRIEQITRWRYVALSSHTSVALFFNSILQSICGGFGLIWSSYHCRRHSYIYIYVYLTEWKSGNHDT